MKTVADLKRKVVKGCKLRLDRYQVRGVDTGHKYLNVTRVVTVSNTVGFASAPLQPDANNSYCDWPKRGEFRPDPDGTGFWVDHEQFAMHYTFVEEQ